MYWCFDILLAVLFRAGRNIEIFVLWKWYAIIAARQDVLSINAFLTKKSLFFFDNVFYFTFIEHCIFATNV